MALTDAFLNVCRGVIANLPERSAFITAGTLANDTRAERSARWGRLYGTDATSTSVASRYRKAIRDMVNAEADKYATAGSGTVSPLERESAIRTLVTEFVPAVSKPKSSADELAALDRAISEEQLS